MMAPEWMVALWLVVLWVVPGAALVLLGQALARRRRRAKRPRLEGFVVGWVVCLEGGQSFAVVRQCVTANRERAELLAYEAMMRDVREFEAEAGYGWVKPCAEAERVSWFTSKGDVI